MQSKLKKKYKLRIDDEGVKRIIVKTLYKGVFHFKEKAYLKIVPPIVSDEVWELANMYAAKRYKHYQNDSYYFANKVFCECGHLCTQESANKIYREKKKTYYYYYCEHCKKRLNQQVIADVTAEEIVLLSNKQLTNQIDIKFKKRIQIIESKINKTIDLFADAKINSQTYTKTILELTKKRDRYKEIYYPSLVKDLSRNWSQLNDMQKRSVVDSTIRSIKVNMNLKIVLSIEWKK